MSVIYTSGQSYFLGRNARSTWFGGGLDPEDNSIGAWGFDSKTYNDFPGVALPMRSSHIPSLVHSEVPLFKPFTPIHIYSHETGKSAWGALIDIGPSGDLDEHDIDLTPALHKLLGHWDPTKSAADQVGLWIVDYRVVLD